MEVIQSTKQANNSRAKEIDTGAVPLPFSNVEIGLPIKPDPTQIDKTGTSTNSWRYEDIVGQMKLMADLPVSTSTKGYLWSFQNTWVNVAKFHFRNNMDKLFGIKSWKLKFLFEFRSNFQQVGQLCLFYSNLPSIATSYHFNTQAATTDPYDDYTVMTQLPHRKIPMGEDVDIPLTCTWISPFKGSFATSRFKIDDAGNFDPIYDMGTIFLYVPFEMQVATGVDPQMTVRIWSSLSDVQYSAYQPSDSAI